MSELAGYRAAIMHVGGQVVRNAEVVYLAGRVLLKVQLSVHGNVVVHHTHKAVSVLSVGGHSASAFERKQTRRAVLEHRLTGLLCSWKNPSVWPISCMAVPLTKHPSPSDRSWYLADSAKPTGDQHP